MANQLNTAGVAIGKFSSLAAVKSKHFQVVVGNLKIV